MGYPDNIEKSYIEKSYMSDNSKLEEFTSTSLIVKALDEVQKPEIRDRETLLRNARRMIGVNNTASLVRLELLFDISNSAASNLVKATRKHFGLNDRALVTVGMVFEAHKLPFYEEP